MTTLKYNAQDIADVKKTFTTLIVRNGMSKDQALIAMNQNPLAVANADTWYVETQGVVTVSDPWVAGIFATRGLTYTYQGKLYIVIQSHTTQAGWEPPTVPNLFNPLPVQYPNELYPRWRQPLGAEDAYKQNDRVTHQTKNYSSNINANVWAPPEQWTLLP